MIFDPLYVIRIAPALLLAMWAQGKVHNAHARASRIRASSGMSGAQTAQRILSAHGINNVRVEMTRGFLGDHYDSRKKALRLSPDVYNGNSLASVGIAAHEVGHAIQDRTGYAALKLRNGIVPLAGIGSNFAFFIFLAGMLLQISGLVLVAIVLFASVVVFQLINLPVEYNASSRARKVLVANGVIAPSEEPAVARVLDAAAWTYVAATISAVLTLLYFLMRSGLLGRRD